MKYRIVQKGDEFGVESKQGFMHDWWLQYDGFTAWGSRTWACAFVKRLKQRQFKEDNKIYHKPEDLCGCFEIREGKVNLGGVKPITDTPKPAGQPQGQQPK